MTPWLKRQAAQVRQWTDLDENYSVGEFRLQLHGWEQHRRFVVIRERIRDEKPCGQEESCWTFPAIRLPGFCRQRLPGSSGRSGGSSNGLANVAAAG